MGVSLRDIGSIANSYHDLEVLCKTKSRHHRIALYSHPQLGKILVLDGEVQHVEAWSTLYHEPLVHLSSAFVRDVRSVLILGGGSLFAVAEALKYQSLERLVLVDHEPRVLDVCCEHYVHAKVARADCRVEVRISDIFDAVNKIPERFDLIINDSIDLVNRKRLWLLSGHSVLVGS